MEEFGGGGWGWCGGIWASQSAALVLKRDFLSSGPTRFINVATKRVLNIVFQLKTV
jgi:hypothetical protein